MEVRVCHAATYLRPGLNGVQGLRRAPPAAEARLPVPGAAAPGSPALRPGTCVCAWAKHVPRSWACCLRTTSRDTVPLDGSSSPMEVSAGPAAPAAGGLCPTRARERGPRAPSAELGDPPVGGLLAGPAWDALLVLRSGARADGPPLPARAPAGRPTEPKDLRRACWPGRPRCRQRALPLEFLDSHLGAPGWPGCTTLGAEQRPLARPA